MLRALILALVLFAPALAAAEARCVVLLHGLGRSNLSLLLLEGVLERQGYQVVNSRYPSTKAPLEELVTFVDDAVARCADPGTVDFVTHSMGGILLRIWALKGENTVRIRRAVMLAPPNHGSELVDIMLRNKHLAWLRGPAAAELGTATGAELPSSLPGVAFELGVIAGNDPINPITALLIPGENDGTVSVESTKVAGMNAHIVLPVAHTFMMNDPQVILEVKAFLQTGAFVPPPGGKEALRQLIRGS